MNYKIFTFNIAMILSFGIIGMVRVDSQSQGVALKASQQPNIKRRPDISVNKSLLDSSRVKDAQIEYRLFKIDSLNGALQIIAQEKTKLEYVLDETNAIMTQILAKDRLRDSLMEQTARYVRDLREKEISKSYKAVKPIVPKKPAVEVDSSSAEMEDVITIPCPKTPWYKRLFRKRR